MSLALALGLAPALGCETTEVDDDGDSAADDDGDTGSASTPDDSADDDSATVPDDSADDDGDDTDATPGTISSCQGECDFQLEFECIDVDEHEACFTACSARSQAELDLFLACSNNSPLCSDDPGPRRECLANFLDIDTPGDTGTIGETGTEGPNCVEACQSYLETPCDPPIEGVSSCDEFCAMLSESLQQVAAECLDNAVGCELPADCQLPSGD
jgi:hypothetical protein